MFSASSPETHPMQVAPAGSDADRIVVNVGGVRHETHKSTLMCIPGTRLANLVSDASADPLKHPTSEFFFDRDPKAFAPILNYYRTGKLHCPADVCGQSLEEELSFWGVSETDVEPCCWKNFRQHRDEEEALAAFEPDEGPPDYDSLVGGPGRVQTKACMPKMWALFDDPHSSVAAMIIGLLSLLFILMSIVCFCLGTHFKPKAQPRYTDEENVETDIDIDADMILPTHPVRALGIIELLCVVWFTSEFLIRIISCPKKLKFILNVLNIIDLMAILPFYVALCLGATPVLPLRHSLTCLLMVARCLRLLRIFKLMRRVAGVRALGHSLRASAGELLLLAAALCVLILTFSILAFYGERATHTSISSMSRGLWFAVITMTGVGYGDMYPESWPGMVAAALCAIAGVFFIAMPIPVLVNKFAKYYALTEAKQRRRAKSRRGDGRSEGASAPVWRGVENIYKQ
ncbi:potassium voltage-gated channel subfamily C member 1-like isoform X2 [Sardina pilchardus]|uniref:potassium voltage-gated channel subfamily C member 1-like isoform X2 n=1 Tax=Sardina pilchardus TaxID=27697 RepID=UPI002E0EEAE9